MLHKSMKKNKPHTQLLQQPTAEQYQPLCLTLDERSYQKAIKATHKQKTELEAVLSQELKRLIHNTELAVEINICQGTGLDQWLAEPQRLLLKGMVLLPTENHAFMAMDYQSIHQLASLSLGGEIDHQINLADKDKLTPAEQRICQRTLQCQVRAIQRLLFNQESALPGTAVQQPMESQLFSLVTLKVRLLIGNDALCWYLWLPVDFFCADAQLPPASEGNKIFADDFWQQLPVKGQVEMGRCTIGLKKLSAYLAGQVMPFTLHSDMVFSLHKAPLFHGKVVEDDNRLHFQISSSLPTGD